MHDELKINIEKDGIRLSEAEYQSVVEYAKRKAEISGKDESYLMVLIPDVIKECFYNSYVTNISAMRMEGITV